MSGFLKKKKCSTNSVIQCRVYQSKSLKLASNLKEHKEGKKKSLFISSDCPDKNENLGKSNNFF